MSNQGQIRVQEVTKAVVTVAEMARMVGLSRARFYQLMSTAFPYPVYDVATRRPCYDENMQKTCFRVKQRNCGVNGKPILFYARRATALPSPATARRKPATSKTDPLLQSVRSLGLASATPADVAAAVAALYPNGVTGVDTGEVVRGVFLRIKGQNPSDMQGR